MVMTLFLLRVVKTSVAVVLTTMVAHHGGWCRGWRPGPLLSACSVMTVLLHQML